MSTAVPITTDTLPSNVPKLDVKGTNWAIFMFHFQVAVEAKELWDHFDGTTTRPPGSDPPTNDKTTAVNKWRKNEALVKHLLTQRIPDSTALRVCSLTTVCTMWTEIETEYTEKGTYAQTDLRAQFLESKLPKGTEVCHFLDSLQTKHEELAAVGVTIDETDYHSTIIKSLPSSLANFASNQLASTRLFSSTKTIEPDTLIAIISKEAEHQKAKHPSCHDTKDQDKAMAVSSPAKQQGCGRGRRTGGAHHSGSRCNPPACWTCSSMEHLASFHNQPTKKDGEKKKTAPAEHTAQAVTLDSDSEDGVFGVDDLASDNESIPDLMSVEPSDDEWVDDNDVEDWFSVTNEDSPCGLDLEKEEFQADLVDVEVSVDIAGPLPDVGENLENTAMAVSDKPHSMHQVDLFDSGTTHHISPYRERFENFAEIPPKPFVTANQQKFSATGVGDMVIEVPNGYDIAQLRLTEVLYSPEVGYTLVSIGCLDKLGLSTTFAEGHCTIHGMDGETIGHIPCSSKGLYRVVHDNESTHSAEDEQITVMELHHQMGHIAPSVARCLAENGLVSGLVFDDLKDKGTFCESCVYAKAT